MEWCLSHIGLILQKIVLADAKGRAQMLVDFWSKREDVEKKASEF